MKRIKRLDLNKETIRELNNPELEQVEGGKLSPYSLLLTGCGRRCYQSAWPNKPC